MKTIIELSAEAHELIESGKERTREINRMIRRATDGDNIAEVELLCSLAGRTYAENSRRLEEWADEEKRNYIRDFESELDQVQGDCTPGSVNAEMIRRLIEAQIKANEVCELLENYGADCNRPRIWISWSDGLIFEIARLLERGELNDQDFEGLIISAMP